MIPTGYTVLTITHISYSDNRANARASVAVKIWCALLLAPSNCLVNRYILPFHIYILLCVMPPPILEQ